MYSLSYVITPFLYAHHVKAVFSLQSKRYFAAALFSALSKDILETSVGLAIVFALCWVDVHSILALLIESLLLLKHHNHMVTPLWMAASQGLSELDQLLLRPLHLFAEDLVLLPVLFPAFWAAVANCAAAWAGQDSLAVKTVFTTATNSQGTLLDQNLNLLQGWERVGKFLFVLPHLGLSVLDTAIFSWFKHNRADRLSRNTCVEIWEKTALLGSACLVSSSRIGVFTATFFWQPDCFAWFNLMWPDW